MLVTHTENKSSTSEVVNKNMAMAKQFAFVVFGQFLISNLISVVLVMCFGDHFIVSIVIAIVNVLCLCCVIVAVKKMMINYISPEYLPGYVCFMSFLLLGMNCLFGNLLTDKEIMKKYDEFNGIDNSESDLLKLIRCVDIVCEKWKNIKSKSAADDLKKKFISCLANKNKEITKYKSLLASSLGEVVRHQLNEIANCIDPIIQQQKRLEFAQKFFHFAEGDNTRQNYVEEKWIDSVISRARYGPKTILRSMLKILCLPLFLYQKISHSLVKVMFILIVIVGLVGIGCLSFNLLAFFGVGFLVMLVCHMDGMVAEPINLKDIELASAPLTGSNILLCSKLGQWLIHMK